MARQDKIGAAVLGLLLFSGLFYFIYTTMKNPLPSEFGDDEFSGETFDDEEFDEDLADLEAETPEPSTSTATPGR